MEGEVAIDVSYAGVGFVDTLFRSGAFDLPTPFVPGLEATGRIRAVGSDVVGFTPGQPVAADLAYRDILRQPAPTVLPLEDAAEIHRALEGRAAPARTVLAID